MATHRTSGPASLSCGDLVDRYEPGACRRTRSRHIAFAREVEVHREIEHADPARADCMSCCTRGPGRSTAVVATRRRQARIRPPAGMVASAPGDVNNSMSPDRALRATWSRAERVVSVDVPPSRDGQRQLVRLPAFPPQREQRRRGTRGRCWQRSCARRPIPGFASDPAYVARPSATSSASPAV